MEVPSNPPLSASPLPDPRLMNSRNPASDPPFTEQIIAKGQEASQEPDKGQVIDLSA